MSSTVVEKRERERELVVKQEAISRGLAFEVDKKRSEWTASLLYEQRHGIKMRRLRNKA